MTCQVCRIGSKLVDTTWCLHMLGILWNSTWFFFFFSQLCSEISGKSSIAKSTCRKSVLINYPLMLDQFLRFVIIGNVTHKITLSWVFWIGWHSRETRADIPKNFKHYSKNQVGGWNCHRCVSIQCYEGTIAVWLHHSKCQRSLRAGEE